MNATQLDFVTQAAGEALAALRIRDDVSAETLASLIVGGVVQWQDTLPDGDTLTLLRLYSPVVDREEVFLGGVLLNDFLNKALLRAAKNLRLQGTPVIQDLESAYILLAGGEMDSATLAESLRHEVRAALPDLYFGKEDLNRGLHGGMSRLLSFTKSDFEPLPVYSVPSFLAAELERAIRRCVVRLLDADDYSENFKTVMATLAFFYGQKGGGNYDTQSFEMFLSRLVNHYKVIPADRVKKVFGLEQVTKPGIKEAFRDGQYKPEEWRQLLLDVATFFWKEIGQGNDEWFMRFIRNDDKLIEMEEEDFIATLLNQVQVGSFVFQAARQSNGGSIACCPMCGYSLPTVRESYVTVGINKARFKTRNSKRGNKRQDPVICARCAVASYLLQRALGTVEVVWQKRPRKTAQMPPLYNTVFHYGRYDDWEITALQRQIDLALKGSREKKPTEQLLRELADARRLAQVDAESGEVPDTYDDPAAALLALAEAPESYVEVATNVLAQAQSDIQADVLALGAGAERLLVFVLPQLRPGSKEGIDFVQHRFSRSRLAVFTLLAFLRRLTGGQGPWYFQSLPRLSPGAMQADRFYIRNRPEPVEHNLRRYSAIADFARRVVKYQKGHSLLADWILLADHLLEDPLGTFSEVVRASPKTKRDFSKDYRDKFKYHSLGAYGSIDDTGLGVVDSTEYLALYEMLHEMAKGGDTMPKQVPIEQMDVFCNKLFRALDRAGLLPIHLGEAAHTFEKHSRLLFGLLGRYEQVEAALAEWETRALRGMHDSRRETAYPHFHALREWLTASENRQLFEGDGRKDNLNHLKRSLYSRIYIWLYPRRKLTAAYTHAHIGNVAQFQPEAIARDFVDTTESVRQELDLAADDPAVADAQAFAIAKRSYYRTWKPSVETPDEEEEEAEF